VESEAVLKFFQEELAQGRENYLRQRALRFRIGGKRRFSVNARAREAYVWQRTRFADDEEFWGQRLGVDGRIQPVKNGRCLRFYLTSQEDFKQFKDAVNGELQQVEFLSDEEPGEEEGA
jgi:hypothetical protein